MRLLTRRRVAALGTLGVLALAGSAFAYWTGSGSGTGTGTVGTPASIALSGTVASGIAPGNSRLVTFTATNTSDSPVYVTKISLTNITTDGSHSTCLLTDFTMADTSEGVEVPASTTGYTFTAKGTLAFADTGISQDGCKGAPLTLSLAGS